MDEKNNFKLREGTTIQDFLRDYFYFIYYCTGGLQNMQFVHEYSNSEYGRKSDIFSITIREDSKSGFRQTIVSIPGYTAEIYLSDSRVFITRNTQQGPKEIFLQTLEAAPAELRAYERLRYTLVAEEETQQFIQEIACKSFEVIRQALEADLLHETPVRTVGASIIFPTE